MEHLSRVRDLGDLIPPSSHSFHGLARGNNCAAYGGKRPEDHNQPHLCGDEDEKVKNGVCDRDLEAARVLGSGTYK